MLVIFKYLCSMYLLSSNHVQVPLPYPEGHKPTMWKETPPLGDSRGERPCMQVGKLQGETHRVNSSQLDGKLDII